MGDLRAGTGGNSAAQPTGKRVARHSAEQVTDQPYVGRRVAPTPGRRRAEPSSEVGPPSVFSEAPSVGRRALRLDVVPFAPGVGEVTSATLTPVEPVAGVPVFVEPVAPVLLAPPVVEPVLAEPAVVEPTLVEPGLVEPLLVEPAAPVEPAPVAVAPVEVTPAPIAAVAEPDPAVDTSTLVLEPISLPAVAPEPAPRTRAVARRTSSAGRRAARRRSALPLPGAPLLIGVAVLAVSAGGALQGMRSDADAAADAHRLTPASALSGTSSVGSASLLGNRAPVVSRDSDRLQATADAQAKQRAEALTGIASKAQQQSQKIQQHAWVLPVTPGVYHLTARFGDYSYLWSNFHTGLDFAAPTGTPIMAVAAGTITETAYSGAYGNRTIERLPDGTELWYCHQNEFGTQVGAKVTPGEVIGYVGSTGNVTGPHLHLEVHPGGGDAVDPYAALVAHGLYPGPPS